MFRIKNMCGLPHMNINTALHTHVNTQTHARRFIDTQPDVQTHTQTPQITITLKLSDCNVLFISRNQFCIQLEACASLRLRIRSLARGEWFTLHRVWLIRMFCMW